VFTAIRSTKEEPSSAPAASPRLRRRPSPWPPGRHPHARLGVPRPRNEGKRVRAAPGPYPPDLSQQAFKGRDDAGSSRTPLRHARRTHTIWQYWRVPASSGLLPPSPALPGSGCPQLRRPAATGSAADGLSPPLESSAPHGARGSRLRVLASGDRARRAQRGVLFLTTASLTSHIRSDGKEEADRGAAPNAS
jgi:hypothetical protein